MVKISFAETRTELPGYASSSSSEVRFVGSVNAEFYKLLIYKSSVFFLFFLI